MIQALKTFNSKVRKVQATSLKVSLKLPFYWKSYWNQRGQIAIVTCLKVM